MLRPHGTLRGRLVAADGNPLPQTWIEAVPFDAAGVLNAPAAQLHATDAAGRFEVSLPRTRGDREELVAEGAASCCRFVRRNPETPRKRFLSRQELRRLGAAIDQAEKAGTAHPSAIVALRLLIVTGCRRSEILKLKWHEVDFERSCLRPEDSKTGRRVVPLGAAALELLREAPRAYGSPFVCAGDARGGRYSNIQSPWRRIRKAAGLEDVRIHDLRHTFASMAASQGVSLPIIGHLLGHKRPETTARYAHLARPVVQSAANSVADQIVQDLG